MFDKPFSIFTQTLLIGNELFFSTLFATEPIALFHPEAENCYL